MLKMANMFSGNQVKKIPKNFKECYKTDNVTQNLWLWCERLEKWGFRIFIALLIIGITTIIKEGVEAAQLLNELYIDMDEIRTATAEYGIEIKSVYEVVIENIFLWSLYSFLEYCAYHILALLVGSLANIVQHTKITANIALYNSAKAEGVCENNDSEEKSNDSEEKNLNDKVKCNARMHKKYISKIKDTDTDSEDAYWQFDPYSHTKSLICNHCEKVLFFVKKFEENENYKEVVCPICNRKLQFEITEHFGKCPFCKIRFEIQ